ncbi:MAG: YdeI/OmpD-associated family protein [Bacteroidaceae bacterium]|nr:YdeI/OmpD-associated family protein [Bacteroidaceae bacterium]
MNTFYTNSRDEWRAWLSENFAKEKEVWFVFPMKAAGEEALSYNDAVEEALCFGWIDGVIKNIDSTHRAQRFTPRKPSSPYSRPNIERLIWLEKYGLIHPSVRERILDIINAPYIFPEDIIAAIKQDQKAWANYNNFTLSYKRIRIAYIDAARKRPDEFRKRLDNFIRKTRDNTLITGYGGIDKYYKATTCPT